MEFVNENKDVKVRQTDPNGYVWKTVRTGESVELPKSVGLAYRFTPKEVTKGKAGEKEVETKQFEDSKKKDKSQFQKTLQKIKGIGKKTAEDILKVYQGEKELVDAIANNKPLPFRDDIEKLLHDYYGSKK